MHITVTKDIQDVTASTDHLSKVITESRKMINDCVSWDLTILNQFSMILSL